MNRNLVKQKFMEFFDNFNNFGTNNTESNTLRNLYSILFVFRKWKIFDDEFLNIHKKLLNVFLNISQL